MLDRHSGNCRIKRPLGIIFSIKGYSGRRRTLYSPRVQSRIIKVKIDLLTNILPKEFDCGLGGGQQKNCLKV